MIITVLDVRLARMPEFYAVHVESARVPPHMALSMVILMAVLLALEAIPTTVTMSALVYLAAQGNVTAAPRESVSPS